MAKSTASKAQGNSAGRLVSLVECAAILGVHRNTVTNWINKGMPVVQRADRNKGQEWQINVADVLAWREEQAADAVRQTYDNLAEDGEITLDEAKRRKILAEAQMAELDLAKARNAVVGIQDIAERIGEEYAEVRQLLLAIPDVLAQPLSAETDAREVHRIIKEEISNALRHLCADDGEEWVDDADS